VLECRLEILVAETYLEGLALMRGRPGFERVSVDGPMGGLGRVGSFAGGFAGLLVFFT
jgi:hypothetical protein